MDLEEALDFCLDLRTKFAQRDNFIFINSDSGLLHDMIGLIGPVKKSVSHFRTVGSMCEVTLVFDCAP